MTIIEKAREYDNKMNEGGEGYNPYYAKLAKEMADETRQKELNFWIEWTPIITAERRAAWNLYVRSIQANGKIKLDIVVAREKKQGYTISDLKKAVAKHNTAKETT